MILFLYILYQFINKLHLSFFEKQINETNIFHYIKNSHVFFIPLHIRLAAPQQFKLA